MPTTIHPVSRRRLHSLALLIASIGVLCAPFAPLHAQGIIDRMKQKAKDRANAAGDSVTDAALDKATGAIKCAATNVNCIKKAFGAGKNVKIVDAKGNPVSPADSAQAVAAAGGVPAALVAQNAAAAASPAAAGPVAPAFGEGVFVNYDFVPGDRVIFAEDFAKDVVGDFPKRLQLGRGNVEVADWQGQRFARATSYSTLIIPLPEVLPSRFTLEFDFNGGSGWTAEVNFDSTAGDPTIMQFSPVAGGFLGAGVDSRANVPDNAERPVTHVAVMVDAKYGKAYLNGVRVANAPNTALGRTKAISITVTADQDTPAYVSNIRVAAGGKPLYDALAADGRVATHGILFNTGSDQIRGESKPTLDQIGQMLTEHPELKLTIEGHTDNVGAAPANQTLSEKRAAAVKQFLINNYHVDAARLASQGFGASKPSVPNTTAEGRQQNRRVGAGEVMSATGVLSGACVAALMVGIAGVAGAQGGGPLPTVNSVTATFTGSIHGQIPPSGCAGREAVGSAMALVDFAETTPANAPAGSGTFEISIPTVCVAPFFQALIAKEPLSVQFALGTTASATPTLTVSLISAKIVHLDFGWDAFNGPGGQAPPSLKIGLSSSQVTSAVPGGPAGAGASNAPSAPSAANVAVASGGALSATVKPTTVALAGGATRVRAPAVHATGAAITLIASNALGGAGSSWAIHGVGAVGVHMVSSGGQAVDASFFTKGFHLSGRYAVDGSGTPTGNPQFALDPVLKAQDAKTAQIKSAASAHATLTQAVFSFLASPGGGQSGITVSVKSGQIVGDQVASAAGSTTSATETLQFTVPGLTITDIASGRTAATP